MCTQDACRMCVPSSMSRAPVFCPNEEEPFAALLLSQPWRRKGTAPSSGVFIQSFHA